MDSEWITPSRIFKLILLAAVACADDSHEDSDEDDKSRDKTSSIPVTTFAIVAASVTAAILFLGLIILCCWYVKRRNRQLRNNQPLTNHATRTTYPTAPPAPLTAESTFSPNPYHPYGEQTNLPVILRDSANASPLITAPNRRSSPPPPYESLFSQTDNHGETKQHFVQNE